MRMDDSRLLNQVFCSEVDSGKRKQGEQSKCYKDTLKNSLELVTTQLKDGSHWQATMQYGDKTSIKE